MNSKTSLKSDDNNEITKDDFQINIESENEYSIFTNVELEPSNTILESTIQNSLKESFKELDFENNTISPEQLSQIINQFNDEKLSNNLMNLDDNIEYLEKKNIKYSNEKFEKINNKYSKDYINGMKNYILSLNVSINKISENQLINPIMNINQLIKGNYNYNEELEEKMIILKNKLNDIKRYRRIKGDNNSFYRLIIFGIIESIILYKKIDYLKYLIVDINEIYSNQNIIKYLQNEKIQIKINIILCILLSIYLNIENNNIEEAYKIFVISINSNKNFDIGLILYYKFIIKNYIEENKNKHYSKNINVVIGRLLPEKYENNGNFLFDNFYNENLLKLNIDVEKIIFYITPYILNIHINIYSENKEIEKYYFEENKSNFEINIFNQNGHYDLLYSKYYFDKFQNYFNPYIIDDNLLNKEDEIINHHIEEIDTTIRLNNNDKNKTYNTCQNILLPVNNKNEDNKIIEKSNYKSQIKQNENEINSHQIKNNNENNNYNIQSQDLSSNISFSLAQNRNLSNINNPLQNYRTVINNDFRIDRFFSDCEEDSFCGIFNESIYNKICQKCKKNNNFLSFDICKECLNKEIYNNSISQYKSCIENNKKFDIENVSIKIRNRTFKLIEIFNHLNLGLTIEDYEKIVKSKYCANCGKDIEKINSNSPFICGCCFCCLKCIHNLYNSKASPFCFRCGKCIVKICQIINIKPK